MGRRKTVPGDQGSHVTALVRRCPRCLGKGWVWGNTIDPQTCATCGGTGSVTRVAPEVGQ